MKLDDQRGRELATFKSKIPLLSPVAILSLAMFLLAGRPVLAQETEASSKARQVVDAAIQALGGKTYMDVYNAVGSGRYFMFSKGRKGFVRFSDWTHYKEPAKSRFQLGKGKRQTLTVYNLELNQGWVLEGLFDRKPIPEEEVKDFARMVKRDMDYLFRNRLEEDGLQMFYYGPDDVAGSGELEAVEFVDEVNDSVVVYFNTETHMPVKTESHFTDKVGVRHKVETEFYNWHVIKGVQTALRFDVYTDEELTQQRFFEEIDLNVPIPPEYFLEPAVKEKKEKKNKK